MEISLHWSLEIDGDVQRSNLTKQCRKRQGDNGLGSGPNPL
jgi:hypothetical protein